MEQQRALNALEPYLALSKSATSPRAAADLVAQATSAPQTYVFAELLQTPNIQALRNSPDHVAHLRLLEIFSWGTYGDYLATPNLPPLNPAQHKKLLLLSLLPHCSSPTTLTYTHLQRALFPPNDTNPTTSTSPSTDNNLALESLITTAIYSNLLTGTLDPLNHTLRITSVAPLRDLAPNALPGLFATLEDWESRCGATLADIEAQVAGIRARARAERIRAAKRGIAFEDAVKREDAREEKEVGGFGGGGGNGGGGGVKGMGLGMKIGGGGGGGGGGGSGYGGIGRMLGFGGGGSNVKAGKRDAGDVMDLDGDSGARGNTRGVKRQGRGGDGGGIFGRR